MKELQRQLAAAQQGTDEARAKLAAAEVVAAVGREKAGGAAAVQQAGAAAAAATKVVSEQLLVAEGQLGELRREMDAARAALVSAEHRLQVLHSRSNPDPPALVTMWARRPPRCCLVCLLTLPLCPPRPPPFPL